jgi:hypothetical protein
LRVFSDHPRTIVYINEQRMGATSTDVLQPYVTPEIPVGKYWIKLITPDERWAWEGEKDLEEGEINSIEGKLEDLVAKERKRIEAIWIGVEKLEQGNSIPRAIEAYEAFVKEFPEEKKKHRQARKRISKLQRKLKGAARQLFRGVKKAKTPEERLQLAKIYVDDYPDGEDLGNVMKVIAELDDWYFAKIDEVEGEEKMEMRLAYLQLFPEGSRVKEVKVQIDDEYFGRLERAERLVDRVIAGRTYLERVPDGTRVKEVEGMLAQEERNLEVAIESAEDPRSVRELARQYMDAFPDGALQVKATNLVSASDAMEGWEEGRFCGPSPTGRGADMCFIPAGKFTMGE